MLTIQLNRPKPTFEQRLAQEAHRAKERAKTLPPGKERELLSLKARQLETHSRLKSGVTALRKEQMNHEGKAIGTVAGGCSDNFVKNCANSSCETHREGTPECLRVWSALANRLLQLSHQSRRAGTGKATIPQTRLGSKRWMARPERAQVALRPQWKRSRPMQVPPGPAERC
jgi:hypothetical protein